MAAVTTMNGYSLLGVPLSIIAAGGHSTQVRTGEVATILEHVAQRFHAEVEPLVTFHGWRSVATNEAVGGHPRSNHPSGTALDLNGYRHPYRATTTGFTPAQVVALRRILAEVAPVVRWGGDFPAALRDGMHFEIVGTRAQVAEIAARIARPAPAAPAAAPTPTPTAEDDLMADWTYDEARAALGTINALAVDLKAIADAAKLAPNRHADTLAAVAKVDAGIVLSLTSAENLGRGITTLVARAPGATAATALTDADLAHIATAVADEQHRRSAA